MKKRLMILGAGVYQIPAIIKAKKMGYKTIVLSYNIRNYPGYKYADIPIESDTTDQQKALEIAKKYQISGVFTTGTDVALKTLGYINSSLHLSGPCYEACLLSTDKMRMKKAFAKKGAPTASFEIVKSKEEGLAAAKKIGFPVMVKAINSSGSRGISKASDKLNFNTAWEYSKKYSKPNESIIIEEYLEGIEFGAQAFIYQDKIKLIALHNDTVTPPPFCTPVGHSYPFKYPSLQKEATNAIKKGIKTLGINNSAVNIDLISSSNGIKILEIGARMGATCLPELTHIFTGIDVTAECIKMAVGETPTFDKIKKQPVAGLLIGAQKSGKIKTIKIPQEISDKKVKFFSLDIENGDQINKFQIGPDRIGEIITSGKTHHEAEKLSQMILEKLHIEIQKS